VNGRQAAGRGEAHDDERARLIEIVGGFWPVQALNAAIELDLPKHLVAGPLTAEALAERTQASASSVYRLLRALAALDIVRDAGERRFSLAPAGQLLLPQTAGSLRGMVLHVANLLWPAFGQLTHCVRTGAPPPGIKHGPDGFAALESDPGQAAVFNQSMVDGSRRTAALALAAYDFSRFATVMDVGGGYGAVLAELLKAHGAQRGVILDLSHCAEGARRYLEEQRVHDRAEFRVGSFFEEVPPEADCYVLKYIIHDWNDAYARTIMRRVGDAARASNGTVVLIERIVPERIEPLSEHLRVVQGDLTMMLWDGKERTESEYRALFEQAGLALRRTIPIGEGFSILEGRS
jgi:hypothetical protein